MRFAFTKTSNYNHEEIKEFNTLEELISFLQSFEHDGMGAELILSTRISFENFEPSEYDIGLELYDDWRE